MDRAKPHVFDAIEGPGDSPAQSVCEDKEGGLWVGFNGGGVAHWKEGQLSQFALRSGLASYVRAVFVDRNTNVWAGTRGGLFVRQKGMWPLRWGRRTSRRSARTGRGALVRRGKTVYGDDGQPLAQLTTRDGLGANEVRAIAEDTEGTRGSGPEGGGLNRLRWGGRFSVVGKADGLPSENVVSLCLGSEGVLWVGTSSGLARLQKGTWTRYTKEQGLISNSIGYVIEDGQGWLWIGSNAGLMRAPLRDFIKMPNALSHPIHVRSYGKAEGLPSGECTSGSQPGACRSRQGTMWFPTIKGLVSVEPAKLAPNTNPPPVIIETVRINGRLQNTNTLRAPMPQSAVVPAGSEDIEIGYASLSLSAPEKGRFRYRLEGHEAAEEPVNETFGSLHAAAAG